MLSGGVVLPLGIVLCAAIGCQFFPQNPDGATGSQSRRSSLPRMRSDQEAIHLDVLMIDRRADDPLIGSRLWQEIDQVGVPAETRDLLCKNGILVGHVASSPPPTLQKLLGMSSRAADRPKMAGRSYSIQSGTDMEVLASELWPECNLSVVDPDQSRNVQYEHVHGVFHIKPIRVQDGWVRVEFIPEIHHGELRLRQVATESGFANKTAQDVDKCYAQRFAVTLNVGESAVITAGPDADGNLGDRFFRRTQDGELLQRLLIIRLTDMGRTVKPVDQ
jgi:hypothetical protein